MSHIYGGSNCLATDDQTTVVNMANTQAWHNRQAWQEVWHKKSTYASQFKWGEILDRATTADPTIK